MLKHKNSQYSVEFIILLAFMFLMFLGVYSLISTKVIEAKEIEKERISEDIAALAINEISLASGVVDGYSKTFKIPYKVSGNNFDIQIIGNRELVVVYMGKEYVKFLPPNIRGNVSKGVNTIKKVNGIVYIEPGIT
jgi:uncharacterized protein YpmS